MKVPIDAVEYYPVTERRGTGTRFRPRTLPSAADAAFVRAGVDSVSAAYDVVAADLSHQLSQQGQQQPFPVWQVGAVLADDAR